MKRLGKKRRGVESMCSYSLDDTDILYTGTRYGRIYGRKLVSTCILKKKAWRSYNTEFRYIFFHCAPTRFHAFFAMETVSQSTSTSSSPIDFRSNTSDEVGYRTNTVHQPLSTNLVP